MIITRFDKQLRGLFSIPSRISMREKYMASYFFRHSAFFKIAMFPDNFFLSVFATCRKCPFPGNKCEECCLRLLYCVTRSHQVGPRRRDQRSSASCVAFASRPFCPASPANRNTVKQRVSVSLPKVLTKN